MGSEIAQDVFLVAGEGYQSLTPIRAWVRWEKYVDKKIP